LSDETLTTLLEVAGMAMITIGVGLEFGGPEAWMCAGVSSVVTGFRAAP